MPSCFKQASLACLRRFSIALNVAHCSHSLGLKLFIYHSSNITLVNMTAAQGTPNRGKGGKSVHLIKFDQFFDFLPKWSWGPLDRLKILSWGPLRFSTMGKPILRTFTFSSFLDPNWPLAHFSLSPGHPGGPGHAGAQKVEHLSAKMQKFL